MWREKESGKRPGRGRAAPSDGGVGVARGAAVADGGCGSGGDQDVLAVVLRGLGERVEDGGLDDPHHRVGAVLQRPDLDHLDHLVLRLLALGEGLPGLLGVLLQVAVHPACFI